MTLEEFNRFCATLPGTSHVVQWRGAHVWKVGGKLFAIGRDETTGPSFTFKVTEIAYPILTAMPGLRPAPYLASRGLTWVQHHTPPGLTNAALRDHIATAHHLVASTLPKKQQASLGLLRNPTPRQAGRKK